MAITSNESFAWSKTALEFTKARREERKKSRPSFLDVYVHLGEAADYLMDLLAVSEVLKKQGLQIQNSDLGAAFGAGIATETEKQERSSFNFIKVDNEKIKP